AVLPEETALSPMVLGQCTAAIAFATVAGFVFFFIPAGLGVREDLLKNLLSGMGPVKYIAAGALLLRLNCIVAEAIFAGCTYWIKPGDGHPQSPEAEPT